MRTVVSGIGRGGLTSALLAGAALVLATLSAAETEEYIGPCDLVASKDGGTLFVVNADARQIAWVELPRGIVSRRIAVPTVPTGIALSPDGRKLFVTCASPESRVLELDAASGKTLRTLPAGHTAMSPAPTPDGKRLYVCNRFDGDVSAIDLASGRVTARVKVVREPVAAAVTLDGSAVLVANHLPNARTDAFSAYPLSATVSIIDVGTNKVKEIQLPHGSHSLRDMCLSPDGKHAYVTHIVSNFELIPTQVDQGWANTNVISAIDTEKMELVSTVGMDEFYSGVGNPWGIACTPDSKWVVVAHAGTHQITIVEASALSGNLLYLFISPVVGAIDDDYGRDESRRWRVQLPGKGPRGVVVIGSKAYATEYFSDSLAEVDVRREKREETRSIPLGPSPSLTERRRGELLFNDATICYQQWQSCASCHPDGRTDALNWDLMNDGVGNTKNTKSMVLAHQTPPAMAEAVRPTAEDAVRAGIDHILFTSRPEEDAAAIDEYLKSLRPLPSPYLVGGRLSPAARRGKKLFESRRVGCANCHPAPLYTDLKSHDVGSREAYLSTTRFDTPTLVETWRTGPYLHDGRYVTVKDLLVEGKHGLGGGRLEKLTEEEIRDLVEYVLSL